MDYQSVRKEYSFEAYLPPLGLLYLATPLEQAGYTVSLIDFVAESFSETKLRQALQDTEYVCITITSQVASSAARVAAYIKKVKPQCTIIIGGPHCTLQQQAVLEEINADIAVVGDGEVVITTLLHTLETKGDLSHIKGIYFRKDGRIQAGLPAEEIEDLDTIDFPARHLIKKYTYGKKVISGVTFFAKGRITSIATTRGCPYRCRFCVSKAITKKYRLRSADNVLSELEEIAQDYDSVFVVDDNFLSNKQRAHAIMDQLIKKNFDLEIWIAGIRITDADASLFKKMKQAKVKSIEFGIESGNQEVLDYYDKRITLDQVRKAIKLSKKVGFLTIGNFIIGAPIETEHHIQDSIGFAKKLNLDFAFFNPFYYLKGSAIWDEAHQEGLIQENETFVPADTRKGLGQFTPEEISSWLLSAYKDFYFNPKYIITQFIRQLFVYHHFRLFQAALRIFLYEKERHILAK